MDVIGADGSVFDSELNIKHEPEETIIDVAELCEERKSETALNSEDPEDVKQLTVPNDITCNICYKHFYSRNILETHKLSVHEGIKPTKHARPMGKCELCHKSVLNLKIHENTFHSRPSYKCLLCSFATKYSGNLEAHKRSVHQRVALFPCYQCGKKFKDQSNRNRHTRKVHKKNGVRFECHICPKSVSFNRSDNLNLHLKRIHGLVVGAKPTQSLFSCDLCASTFLIKQSIVRHMHVMHKPKKLRPYVCKICENSFLSNDSLKNHLDSVHLQKFRCCRCKKSFGSAKTLKRHELKKICLKR